MTDEASPVLSVLPDLRAVPLEELSAEALDIVVQRVLPGSRTPWVSVAGFSSAL
jgi:FXSXX-COOH protein